MPKKFITILFVFAFIPALAFAQRCVECHKKITPNIVSDWQLSKHSENEVDCSVCHGDEHSSADDVAKVLIPTPETCRDCHETQVEQFMKGKHAKAWVVMNAMPTIHWQPMQLTEGMKGCGGCHKIGIKSVEDVKKIKEAGGGFGLASCDACHTRHLFSKKEAQQPQACQTCHMGFDHPQWEMYSASKHGVRALLKQIGVLPETAAGPTCQTCHMKEGDHEVRTAWGFLAVRLPLPEDEQWKADQVAILKGLRVLDPQGNPTARLDAVKAADIARLTQEDWQRERDKMISICSECHSENFAKAEMEKGDGLIKSADRLMAEAIQIVAGLYEGKILENPDGYAFPDLLAFHDSGSEIEQKLFVMFLKHRMRTFQGAFHNNPDYSLWYGWSEMRRDITEIRALAETLRKEHAAEMKK